MKGSAKKDRSTEPKHEPFPDYFNRHKWFFVTSFVAGVVTATILFALGLRLSEIELFGLTLRAAPVPAGGSMENSGSVPIESFPVTVFKYDGLQDPNVSQGWAELSISYLEGAPKYLFDYELPSGIDSFGYTGLDFRFDPAQDLSDYKTVTVILNYFDDATFSELFIKDTSNQASYILLGREAPTGGSLQINGTEHTYEIPLAAFLKPNPKLVYEVGLSVDTDITQGKHRITVKKIVFDR